MQLKDHMGNQVHYSEIKTTILKFQKYLMGAVCHLWMECREVP
jgi:hypothetical protein